MRAKIGVLRGAGPIRRNIEQIKDVIIQSIQIHGTSATRKATIWTKFVLKEPKNKDVNGEPEVGSRGWDPTNSAKKTPRLEEAIEVFGGSGSQI